MKRLLPLLAAIIFALTARAASPVTVTLVNVYPGSDIYELEGHSALRLTGADGDFAVSWGQFDFNAPNFVYRFVKGETDYSVALIPWAYFENAYIRQGRRMVGHVIDMDSTQTAALLEFVARNLEPANRIYRYNYVKDNCATRPLRALEAAFGDSIALGPAVVESESSFPVTFRNVMRRYHANYPWYQFGIDLALGSGIDYPLSRREMAFAPVVMDSQLAEATVGAPAGEVGASSGRFPARKCRPGSHALVPLADVRLLAGLHVDIDRLYCRCAPRVHLTGRPGRIFRHRGFGRLPAHLPDIRVGTRGHVAQLAVCLAQSAVPDSHDIYLVK